MSELQSNLHKNLEEILRESSLFQKILCRADQINLPNWYIAGGCITQTVWNWKLKLPPLHGLKDIDLVYFNPHETETEEQSQRTRIKELFSDLPIPIDVINEARVHEWYPKKFGYSIPAYTSSEDGISSWLPAFSLGVRADKNQLYFFAPFGLSDTFNLVLRPNKRQITEEIYGNMVKRLQKDWPTIQVIPYSCTA